MCKIGVLFHSWILLAVCVCSDFNIFRDEDGNNVCTDFCLVHAHNYYRKRGM
jgi:hypothetical protein